MAELEDLVRLRYRGSDGWLTVDQVSDTPGFGYGRRLDLVAIGCWGSNALHVIGFEVKRTVADWRRELDQPGKRQAFVDEVNEFVFVAPWKVIDPKEVPQGCGLLSMNDGGDLRMRVRAKQAKRTPSPDFLTALFRAALRQDDERKREMREVATFRGRALTLQDLQALVEKSHRYFTRHDLSEDEHKRRRDERIRETRDWGDVLAKLYEFGRELQGERSWHASREKIPTYAESVRAAIRHLKDANTALAVARQLRTLADQLSPPAPVAEGATA